MEKAGKVAMIALCFGAVVGLIIFLANATSEGGYYPKRQAVCNTACVDRRTQITDNKCYCLNGNDWVYKIDLEK